eukprot:scaffold107436_cov39-Cyclotella_meneghiniana.AAC.4
MVHVRQGWYSILDVMNSAITLDTEYHISSDSSPVLVPYSASGHLLEIFTKREFKMRTRTSLLWYPVIEQ